MLLVLAAVPPGAAPAWAMQMSTAAAIADTPVPELSRLTGPITLDGRVDETAWDAVPPRSMTVLQPVHGAKPSQRTEIRVPTMTDSCMRVVVFSILIPTTSA